MFIPKVYRAILGRFALCRIPRVFCPILRAFCVFPYPWGFFSRIPRVFICRTTKVFICRTPKCFILSLGRFVVNLEFFALFLGRLSRLK